MMVILEWTETTVNDFKRKFTEDSIRRTVSRPRDSFFNKDFYDACVKWVEDNPEKIDLDKLAPGSVFRRVKGDEGMKQGPGSVRILTTTGWQYADGIPANSFAPLYKDYGHTFFEPVVLVSTDSSVPTR